MASALWISSTLPPPLVALPLAKASSVRPRGRPLRGAKKAIPSSGLRPVTLFLTLFPASPPPPLLLLLLLLLLLQPTTTTMSPTATRTPTRASAVRTAVAVPPSRPPSRPSLPSLASPPRSRASRPRSPSLPRSPRARRRSNSFDYCPRRRASPILNELGTLVSTSFSRSLLFTFIVLPLTWAAPWHAPGRAGCARRPRASRKTPWARAGPTRGP